MKIGKQKIRDLLHTIYISDKKTKAYIFEIQIDKYTDLFNNLDPSPLRRRDLDQENRVVSGLTTYYKFQLMAMNHQIRSPDLL